MLRNRHPAAAYLLVALAATIPASASTPGAQFTVSAQVVPHTVIESVDEPATILLTQADLEQGYKVLDIHYRVHTAGTSRYLLNIAPRAGLTDRIDIDGLGAPISLGETDITVLQQVLSDTDELRLRLRFNLRSGLTAGHYPMPLRLSVSAS